MIRQYQEENVYEALQKRLHFLFQEFDNIYVSFSGGKDSGLLLNLTLSVSSGLRGAIYGNNRVR